MWGFQKHKSGEGWTDINYWFSELTDYSESRKVDSHKAGILNRAFHLPIIRMMLSASKFSFDWIQRGELSWRIKGIANYWRRDYSQPLHLEHSLCHCKDFAISPPVPCLFPFLSFYRIFSHAISFPQVGRNTLKWNLYLTFGELGQHVLALTR